MNIRTALKNQWLSVAIISNLVGFVYGYNLGQNYGYNLGQKDAQSQQRIYEPHIFRKP